MLRIITPTLSAFVAVALAIFVLWRAPSRWAKRIFAGIAAVAAGYNLLQIAMFLDPAVWLVKLQYLAAIFLIPLFAEFPDALLDNRPARPRTRALAWLAAGFFIATLPGDWLIRNELAVIGQSAQGTGGPMLAGYSVVVGILLLRIAWRLLRARFSHYDELVRRQAEFLLIAEALYAICALHDILMRQGLINGFTIPIVDWGTLGFMMVVAYVTLRYRMLDLDIVLGLSIYYSGLTLGMATAYFSFEVLLENHFQRFLGSDSLLAEFLPAMIVVMLFGPLRYVMQRLIDAWFLAADLRRFELMRGPNFLVLFLDRRTDELRALRAELDELIARAEGRPPSADGDGSLPEPVGIAVPRPAGGAAPVGASGRVATSSVLLAPPVRAPSDPEGGGAR